MSIQAVTDATSLVVAIQREMKGEMAVEDLAIQFTSDQALVSYLTSECWKSFRPKVEQALESCQVGDKRSAIFDACRLIYHVSLGNSRTNSFYEETKGEIEKHLHLADSSALEAYFREARAALAEGVHKSLKWHKAKQQVLEVSKLRLYTDELFRERLIDLAEFALNDPESDDALLDNFHLLARLVKEHEEAIMRVATLTRAFFEQELAYNKSQATKLSPGNHKGEQMPHADACFQAGARFLKKLLINNIQALTRRPPKAKQLFRKALSNTLQALRDDEPTVPSWTKVIKDSKESLKVLVNDKFLNIFWDNYFSDAAGFDIQSFVFQCFKSMSPEVQNGVKQLAPKSHEEEVKVLYKQLFKPLKNRLVSFNQIKSNC